MLGALVALALVALLAALLWLQRRVRILQYLVLLRYPIGFALIALALPLVTSYGPAAGLLDNLYVVDHWFAALWIGVATSWLLAVAWRSGELIFRAADERFGLAFVRSEDASLDWANDRWLEGQLSAKARRLATLGVLGLGVAPTLIVLALRSPAQPGLMVAMAALGHGLVSAALDWESQRRPLMILDESLRRHAPRAFFSLQRRFESLRTSELLRGYDDLRGHQVSVLLLAATGLFYLFGAIVLPPWHATWLAQHFPAIGYVLVLATLLALLLPALSFQLDLYRLPPLIVIIAVLLPLHMVSDHDHYFDAPERLAPDAAPLDPELGLARRFADHEDPVLIVVAASGGGGQAAVWTSRVFEGLAAEGAWGERVLDSIALVSTASGGSIGAMYWVDAYAPEGPPRDPASLARLRAAAEGPSLEAMAWGLAYPDALRLASPGLGRRLVGDLDRARAMERVWNARFVTDEAPTLAGWAPGVDAGWRPLLLFNSTAVESGCRVVFAAASLPHDAFAGAIVFPFDRHDLEISTAARLTAAFPYLTPASRAHASIVRDPAKPLGRARTCSDLDVAGQHLVDGGYYDNYGIVSATQWLDRVLRAEDNRFRKVVVIEIRSMSKQFQRSELPAPALVAQLAGPLVTMMSVRTSSQIDRNDEELRRFAREWADKGVTIETIQFEALNEQRLSWSLTAATIAAIRANWTEEPAVVCQRRRLCELVGGRECPAAPACE